MTTGTRKYVLCKPSGWPNLPVLDGIEEKTPEEVHAAHDLFRQLQTGWYYLPLESARERFPNNTLIR